MKNLLILSSLLFVVIAGSAYAAATVAQTIVLGRGTYPVASTSGTMTYSDATVTQTVNGTPAAIVAANGNYNANQIVYTGDPGTITAVVKIEQMQCDNSDPTNPVCNNVTIADVTFTITTGSGAVSASGTMLGTPGFTADTSNNPVVWTAFPGSGTGNIKVDGYLESCVTGAALVCVQVMQILQDPPPTSATPPGWINDLDEAMKRNLVTPIRLFADQMSAVMMQQSLIMGTFLDAKHQMESQKLISEWAAEAHKDYQPDEQFCAIATIGESIQGSQGPILQNTLAINSMMQQRELLSGYSASAWGPYSDLSARLKKYKTVYCDPNDNNGELGTACSGGITSRANADINYYRTLGQKMTLNINFTDATLTPDEEDALALSYNLFNHNVLTPVPEKAIMPGGRFDELQDARALTAVRGVARNSFATLVSYRAAGSGLSGQQLKNVMTGLGVDPLQVSKITGNNPSYFAQMQLLSKKIFQDPFFISSLYVSPENVERLGVALQAIQITNDRERYEASLRREMLLSMILEMRLREEQKRVIDSVGRTTEKQP